MKKRVGAIYIIGIIIFIIALIAVREIDCGFYEIMIPILLIYAIIVILLVSVIPDHNEEYPKRQGKKYNTTYISLGKWESDDDYLDNNCNGIIDCLENLYKNKK